MLQDIIEIICEYVEIEPEKITADSSLRNDVGATSFDLMNIAVAIEEKYGVSVPNQILPRIKTVGDVVSLLEKS
ncbi:MAG: acyl carrier protein [Clostridia bacterium]|nr:acyl carrier protein [Clostridia bacterium]